MLMSFYQAGEKVHCFGNGALSVRTYEACCARVSDVGVLGALTALSVPKRGQDFMENAIGGVVTRAAKDPRSIPFESESLVIRHAKKSGSRSGPSGMGSGGRCPCQL